MIEASTDRLADSVERYGERLASLERSECVGEEEPFDSGLPGALTAREDARFLLGALSADDETVREANRRFESLEDRAAELLDRDAYLDLAASELRARLDAFTTTVCYFGDLEPHLDEVNHALQRRDSIEALVRALDGRVDLPEERIEIDVLDDVLRCRYEKAIETVVEVAIEVPYYPESYWWRHPSIVLEESDAR